MWRGPGLFSAATTRACFCSFCFSLFFGCGEERWVSILRRKYFTSLVICSIFLAHQRGGVGGLGRRGKKSPGYGPSVAVVMLVLVLVVLVVIFFFLCIVTFLLLLTHDLRDLLFVALHFRARFLCEIISFFLDRSSAGGDSSVHHSWTSGTRRPSAPSSDRVHAVAPLVSIPLINPGMPSYLISTGHDCCC